MTASSCCCVELHCGVLRRVKLYQLEDGERWRDAGTGLVRLLHCHCHCQPQAQSASADEVRGLQQLCDAARSLLPATARFEVRCRCCPSLLLCVCSEESEETLLLVHRVAAETVYCLQAETIISWSEPSGDWALSYQDRQRCDETLAAIAEQQQTERQKHSRLSTQADDSSSTAGSLAGPLLRDDDGELLLSDAAETQQAAAAADCSSSFSCLLPLPRPDNLEALHRQLQSACNDSAARSALIDWLTATGSGSGRCWLSCLQSLLWEREAAADEQSLQRIFLLAVGLVNLHDESVLELLLSERQAFLTLCCLEYDPAVCSHLTEGGCRPLPLPLRRHSQALQAARCHRVLALQSAAAEGEEKAELQEMERALHFHYRLSYARDAALLPHLSDAASAAFTSLLFLCRLRVLQRTLDQPHFLHSVAASMWSRAPADIEPSCRCDRRRLAALPPARPCRASFRSGLQLLNELLSLCRNVQPHVRSAFTLLVMEHHIIAIIAERLRETEEEADGAGSGQIAAVVRWCRWLVPAAVGVLSCLLSHCPDAFRASYCLSAARPAAAAASPSVVQLLLSLLCRPELLDAASAGHISAFLRLLADADTEPDTEGEEGGHPAAWRELEHCLMQEEAQQQRVPAALAAFARHAEPQRVRLAAVALLDWLSFCTARLSAHSPLLPALLLRHRLVATCTAFLEQQRVLAAGSSASASLPVWRHSADVLLAVVRFLSAVLSLRLGSLLRAMMEAQSFRLLLCLLRSPRNRDNMLAAAVLDLFTSLAHAQQPHQQLPQGGPDLDGGEGEEAALLLPVLEHVVSLRADAAASCSPLVSAVFCELEQRLQRVRSWKRERQSSGRHPRNALQQRRRGRGDADRLHNRGEGEKRRRFHHHAIQRSERPQEDDDGEQAAQERWRPSLSPSLSLSSSLAQSPSPASAAASPSAGGFLPEYDDSDSGDEEEAADDAEAQRRRGSPLGSGGGERDGDDSDGAEAERGLCADNGDGDGAASGLRCRQDEWNRESLWFDSVDGAAEGDCAASEAEAADGVSSSLFASPLVPSSLEIGWERLQRQRRQQAEAEQRRQQLDIRAASPSSSAPAAAAPSPGRRPIAISLQLRMQPAPAASAAGRLLQSAPLLSAPLLSAPLLSAPAASSRPQSPPVPEFSHIDELEGLHLSSSAPPAACQPPQPQQQLVHSRG